jgi:hypothetical protein
MRTCNGLVIGWLAPGNPTVQLPGLVVLHLEAGVKWDRDARLEAAVAFPALDSSDLQYLLESVSRCYQAGRPCQSRRLPRGFILFKPSLATFVRLLHFCFCIWPSASSRSSFVQKTWSSLSANHKGSQHQIVPLSLFSSFSSLASPET